MKTPHVSVRILLLMITGALTLMIAVLSFKDLYANTVRLGELEDLRRASLLSDELFSATAKLSLERDVAMAMLSSPDSETAADLAPRLAESRAATDAAFRTVLDELASYQFADLVELRVGIASRIAAIEALRPQIDSAISAPRRSRPQTLAAGWNGEVAALLDDTQTLWVRFIGHFVDIDPVATLHLRFKHLLREIRNQASVERALIGQLIAENVAPSPQRTAQLLRAQGAAEANWTISRTIAEQSGLAPAISNEYADARSHYDTLRDMFEETFYVPGARFAGYPVTTDLWFELSTQSQETFQALSDATVVATRAHIETLIARAHGAILAQALMLAFATLLCAASFWLVIRRVIQPINAIIGELKREMGERGPAIGDTHSDEIVELRQVLAVFKDSAAEVRRTARELTHSQRRIAAIVDNAVDGLMTLDASGNVLSFNPACERMFGFTAAEAEGLPVTLFSPGLYADGEHEELSSYIAAPGTPVHAHEIAARRKDGSMFPMDISVSTYQLEGEQRYSAVVRDVTARKSAEAALLGYTHALERSNRELDDFAYIASHDLKEPLRGIHNHARFLLEDNEEKLDEESAKRLHRLVFLSQRMERLVNDLLYFSRLGRQEIAIQPTDLVGAVRDIESTLEHFLEERSARIIVKGELPQAVCDKPRVTELLRNLITNAVKYNDKQDKVVEIGYLPVKGRTDGRPVRKVYYVRDNGRGIAPEFHQDVFRIFKRLQASEGAEDGTGVGLTFVKKIVERHGGEIWIESEPGEGATFYFTLEASRDDGTRLGSEVA